MAEWKPFQIAAAGEIQALADSASALADTVKETLTLANLGMSAVKILAQLQNINPLLIALDALADEILKEIALFKEAGYYYLMIDPYYIKNVTPEPAFTYGFEHLRNKGGKLLWQSKLYDSAGEFTGLWNELVDASPIFPKQAQLDSGDVKPLLATPRKLIPGGYNPYENSLVDPLASISPYPKFSTAQVLEEFSKAFDDEGDVPRYKALDSAPKKIGTIVYDRAGSPVSGWDKTKDFGLQLYDVGKTNQSLDYTIERKPVNSIIQFGKPICHNQSVRHMLSEVKTNLEACKLMTYQGAWLADQEEDGTVQMSMAKLFVTETALDIVLTCQKVLGAYGYVRDFDMERYVRDMLAMPIIGGSSAIQKNNIANRLKLPRK